MKNKKKFCFDIDGIICSNTWGNYKLAKPIKKNILIINKLYKKNHMIILFTSRYMGRNNERISEAKKNGYNFTNKQLLKWGVKFHKLIFGKPSYDYIIDDKCISFDKSWKKKIKLFIK